MAEPPTYPHIIVFETAATQRLFVPAETEPEPPDPEEPPEPGEARATISIDGHEYAFLASDGQPLDTSQAANLPAYTATITRRDGTTATVEAPSGHYWFGRWRWQSAPRPVRRTYAQLAAQNLIPHFDTRGLA